MKKFVLLIIAILIANTMTIQKVNASNKAFYEAEYAGNIYLRRSLNGEVKYQRARMFREQGTNNIAYCIEPFVNFGDGTKPCKDFHFMLTMDTYIQDMKT